jgi:predicted alpha/beta-hydrolase family hydrolase
VSEGDDIQEVLRVRIVADALTGGDLDALIELSDALEATGTPEKIRTFVLSSYSSCSLTQRGTRWLPPGRLRGIAT